VICNLQLSVQLIANESFSVRLVLLLSAFTCAYLDPSCSEYARAHHQSNAFL